MAKNPIYINLNTTPTTPKSETVKKSVSEDKRGDEVNKSIRLYIRIK